MNEKQKEYSLIKIRKHEFELEQLEKQADKNVWFIYGCIGLAFLAFNFKYAIQDVNDIVSHISGAIGWAGVLGGIDNLKKMIFNLSKKAGVENAIERIDYEMKMSEFEESNDKGGPRK